MNKLTPSFTIEHLPESNIQDRQIITQEIIQNRKNEENAKSINNVDYLQWPATRESKDMPGHIENELMQQASERFKKIFNIEPQKISYDISLPPFNWPLDKFKPSALGLFQNCLSLLREEKNLMHAVEQDIEAYYKCVKAYKENLKQNGYIDQSVSTSSSNSADGPACLLKLLIATKETIGKKEVTKFYLFNNDSTLQELKTFSAQNDCVGALANYLLISVLHPKLEKEVSVHKETIALTHGTQKNQYIDLLVPSLSGEIILYKNRLEESLPLFKNNAVDDTFGSLVSKFYKLDKRVLEIFKKNQKAQNDLYQLIYSVTEKLTLKVSDFKQRQCELAQFRPFPKNLYLDAKEQQKQNRELQEKVRLAHKAQQELLGSTKKNVPKNKTPSKPNLGNLEKKEAKKQLQDSSVAKIELEEKNSIGKLYEFPLEHPICNFTSHVTRWFSLQPGEELPFKEYSHLSRNYQKKAQYLHDFSPLVDHFIFNSNFVYVEGDCRHLFVAYEFEDGTIDTGVTTYHFNDTHCNHRFHSRFSPTELMTQGFSHIMDDVFKETLVYELPTEKDNLMFDRTQCHDKCWINEKHGYVTIFDDKYKMKIHIYRKVGS